MRFSTSTAIILCIFALIFGIFQCKSIKNDESKRLNKAVRFILMKCQMIQYKNICDRFIDSLLFQLINDQFINFPDENKVCIYF